MKVITFHVSHCLKVEEDKKEKKTYAAPFRGAASFYIFTISTSVCGWR